MASPLYLSADSFSDATDAFRCRCTVPIIVCLSEQDVATQPAPPHIAFKVPESSIIAAISRPVHEGFRRYLAEPNKAPLFWLSRDAAGKDPVPWSIPTGLLAQQVQHEHDLDDDEAAAQSQNKFKKTHVVFPIKLFANFRVTKKGDVFPFFAAHLNASQLVDALSSNALHGLKRSVAIMDPDAFAKFTGKLNPEDMKAVYDLSMMDSVSISRRSELSKFHKKILSTIKVKSWPVMLHSLESGKTLTLAIPGRVVITNDNNNNNHQNDGNNNNTQDEAVRRTPASPTSQRNQHNQRTMTGGGASNDSTDSSTPAGSPIIVRGSQGQFVAHRQPKQQHNNLDGNNKNDENDNENNNNGDNDDNDDDDDESKRPTTFGDLVKCLYLRMNPGHLDKQEGAATVSDESSALDLLRRRLIVAGLPDSPLPETPLKWLMEHLVGCDLALHILMLPPNHHTK